MMVVFVALIFLPQLRLIEWDYPRLASRLPVCSKDPAWSLITTPSGDNFVHHFRLASKFALSCSSMTAWVLKFCGRFWRN
ncbi:uncharacterized protein F5147DRAFT_720712 [Suillus discolor]|uniref:Secreted protein n=1 Tax=Suillus discolor TaxID=1912936 RepID=A0A9P7EWR1_9AGAM|nr:uncharacterized protein F5147DRAFT_720712 [Suillus discolor]KAG2093493.1 hypothetical protein F5147DRAFT_720712 [Suillus discolor]